MKYLYYVILFLFSLNALAQDLVMQNGAFTRCAPDKFYDSGGASGFYGDNENFIITICPSDDDAFIILDFTAFSTQLNTDVLTIYDGDDVTAPLVGSYSGAAGPGKVIASETNTSGCLTVQFVSNGSGTTTGWAADIICAVPCQDIDPFVESTIPEANATGVVQIAANDSVTFTGNANFATDGTGATYKWNFGFGPAITGQTVTRTFANAGQYNVILTVTDNNPLGCSETTTIQVFVVGANIVVNTSAFTIEQLVQDVLIDSPCAAVSNITSSTGTNFSSVNGIGYFVSDGSMFPFTDGVLLTSGDATAVRGPNNNALSAGGSSWPGDAQLASIVGIVSNNASIIEFDFVPLADSISFDFLMASEEYNGGSFECDFSDAFAFLLTDSNGTTTNLAVLPGTTTPILVTNIHEANSNCAAINEQYFGGYTPSNQPPMSFDGRTEVFTAQSAVTPGETYHIKLVISDARDTAYDSGVFLKAGSFNLGGNLGEDITIAAGTAGCGGADVLLDTNVPTAAHIWFRDGVEIAGETNSTLTVTEPGTYAVDVYFSEDCQFSSSILVEFKPSPVANTPEDLSICINETAGEFDLTDNDENILGDQNPDDYITSYHLTEQDAIDNVAELTSPYTNVSNPQVIYARIADTSQECFDTTPFEIGYTSLEINNAVTPFEVCDDNADGFAMFTLTDKDVEVIGDLEPTTASVAYHVSQADADSGTNALTSPYVNVDANNQTIFVSVASVGDPGCFNTSSLELVVNPLPIATTPAPLKVCDDDFDGFASFDLTLKTAEIVGGQTNLTLTYHESQEDANTGDNPKASPYTNINPSVQTMYARLETDATGCFAIAELTLIVEEIPEIAQISDYELCDDNTSGDETETFDLSSKTDEVINGQANLSVNYYLSLEDAETGNNPLPNDYSNIATPQTIFYSLTNTSTFCTNTGSLDLVVKPLPIIFDPTPLEVCDDGVPDGITSIDLSMKNSEVTGNNPGYTVSYHKDQADADSDTDALPIPYTNEANGQVVLVRVEDNTTSCHATTSLVLTVQQAPVANDPAPLEYCDPDSDGFGVFDL
ncbi:PKD domain-containing protein, partial [Subsaximicrobium wynnwilliamsii]